MVRIGLTTNYERIDGISSLYIACDYVNAIIEQNAVPVMIPVTGNLDIINHYLENVDGLLLTGGEDIDPSYYGEKNTGLSRNVCRERDMAEMYIIERSLDNGRPILAICRGFQILNVFCGGTLYQDIPSQYAGEVGHANVMKEREALHHEVGFVHGTYIAGLFEAERVMVNSRHHQGVRKLGDGLRVSASSDDGIIEAFEDPGRGIVAVQWHPENITGVSAGCSRLFRDLVDRACSV